MSGENVGDRHSILSSSFARVDSEWYNFKLHVSVKSFGKVRFDHSDPRLDLVFFYKKR